MEVGSKRSEFKFLSSNFFSSVILGKSPDSLPQCRHLLGGHDKISFVEPVMIVILYKALNAVHAYNLVPRIPGKLGTTP